MARGRAGDTVVDAAGSGLGLAAAADGRTGDCRPAVGRVGPEAGKLVVRCTASGGISDT